MSGSRRRLWAPIAAGCLALAVAVAPAPAPAAKKKTPKVVVRDDVFSPTSLKIKQRTKVKFKWARANENPHDVALDKGPKGVKKSKFHSDVGFGGDVFKPRFDKRGTYRMLCTLHPDVMRVEIEVKRKRKR